ncbi:ABC transporter permease [Mesorhizobium sp. B2-4-15]|uniref:ABC transporter permease n=1 Tax=Mesorhizobium sp. B2-4-15 TaxID=2589934 RepID=UPI001153ECB4|nr:ABC transporter permease [Mesorhizobium sp. B2-4-15]TPK73600.1 ABC transporter permease [Mesorhizobium sp. B2-4-15]
MTDIVSLIIKRLGLGLLTMLVVSILIFFAVELLPGDSAQAALGQMATGETVAAMRKQMGLDVPAIVRYFYWLQDFVHGDFGTSMISHTSVAGAILGRFANSFFLAGFAAIIAIPLAVSLGVAAALFRDTIFDKSVNVTSLTAVSAPEFLLGYILVVIFAVKLRWFPPISNIRDGAEIGERIFRSFLPAMTLVLVATAHMMRMTRAAIINVLAGPYIEMARLKGVPPWRVIVRHALPNAWAPIINVVTLSLAYMITGVVLVEVVFDYPGIGQLLVDSVSKRDFPIVQACCLIFAAIFILLNIAADVGSILTNPRLKRPK